MGKKAVFHIVYWVLAWGLANLMFGYEDLLDPTSLLYSSVMLGIAAGVSYWIVYFLIPRYLVKGRYGLFLAYLLFTVIVSLDLELLATMLFIIFAERFQVMVFFHSSREIYSFMGGTYFIVFLSVAIKLVEYWYLEQKRRQSALKEKVETELKLLKSQIHPHFLFNTLNNIYSLAMKKSDRTPDAVLKLSELLDYLIYQGETDKVSLEKELQFIRNYLELEQLRFGDRLEVDFGIQGEPAGIQIAPFLLIPLVENSFKHGVSLGRNKQRLKIGLDISGGNFEFCIENSMPEKHTGTQPPGGMGLSNLVKRLELIYPGNYSLETREESARFMATLVLKT